MPFATICRDLIMIKIIVGWRSAFNLVLAPVSPLTTKELKPRSQSKAT